jgi:hypothetical protein
MPWSGEGGGSNRAGLAGFSWFYSAIPVNLVAVDASIGKSSHRSVGKEPLRRGSHSASNAAFIRRSRVSGSSRTRAPKAFATAFAMAPAVGPSESSPTPVGGKF